MPTTRFAWTPACCPAPECMLVDWCLPKADAIWSLSPSTGRRFLSEPLVFARRSVGEAWLNVMLSIEGDDVPFE